MAVIACALPLLGAAAPETAPPPPPSDVFPARTSGSEGTNLAVQAGGEAERAFQTIKERERVKAEAARIEREAAERKAAEAARIERERLAAEQAAAQQAASAAAAAAAAEQAKALQDRMAAMTTPGELFALSDELTTKGDVAGSRAALRALIARFPDHKFADMAATMLSGVPVPVAPAAAPAASVPPATASAPAAAVTGNACLASIAAFNAVRPVNPGAGSLVERQVFYGKYYEQILDAVPACRADAATTQRVKDEIQANLAACAKTPGANCADGVADTPVGNIDAAYERIVAQAQAQAASGAPATPPPAPPTPAPGTEPKP